MKRNIVAWFMSVIVCVFIPSLALSQDLAMVTPEASGNVIKIVSITPSNDAPLNIGDMVEIAVEVEYKVVKAPASITLTIQKGEMTGGITDAILGSAMEVVTDQEGTVTLKHKIIVPDTKSIQVFTPLLIEGEKTTSIVDMKMYQVVAK